MLLVGHLVARRAVSETPLVPLRLLLRLLNLLNEPVRIVHALTPYVHFSQRSQLPFDRLRKKIAKIKAPPYDRNMLQKAYFLEWRDRRFEPISKEDELIMSFFVYDLVLFIHITAAVMGLGVVFGFPILARTAKTAEQAKYTLHLFKKLEILPKAGSITLLLSGIVFAILEPSLWSQGWFIASMALYFAAQVLVIGILPKMLQQQSDILDAHTGSDLPAAYREVSKRSARVEGVTHLLAFLLILLMVFKPF